MRLGKWTMGAVALLTALAPGLGVAAGNEVNVYSYRQPFLVQPLFDAFTKATGITVNGVHARKGLGEVGLIDDGQATARQPTVGFRGWFCAWRGSVAASCDEG